MKISIYVFVQFLDAKQPVVLHTVFSTIPSGLTKVALGKSLCISVITSSSAGGGAVFYFLVLKPKQGKKVPSDLDDFDLEDEEEYFTEDEN